jgi:4-hydroxybenzoate polyprenyltransferase
MGDMNSRIFNERLKAVSAFPPAIGDPADGAPAGIKLRLGYVRALRPHQWAKNSLVIVPLVTSHRLTAGAVASTILAIIAFSLAASSAYILNDLVDLSADRNHPSKQRRPFASGAVPVSHGLTAAPILLAAAAGVALLLPWRAGAALIAYAAMNFAYSLFLKRKMLLDVMTLAGLYTLRVIAGAAAIEVSVSEWLLVFSMFIFLALALVKRHAEMVLRVAAGLPDPANRDYRAADLPVLIALAGASGCAAVVVLALYIASPEQLLLYRQPRWLYLICPLLLYWIARVLMLSNRGELPDDPVVFALKDPISLGAAVLTATIVAAAAYC